MARRGSRSLPSRNSTISFAGTSFPGADHVYTYASSSKNRVPSVQTESTSPTASVDDVLELVAEETREDHPMPTLYVEPMVWESMYNQSRLLWGLEACIEKSLPDRSPEIDSDAKGMMMNGQAAALVVDIEPKDLKLTGSLAHDRARHD